MRANTPERAAKLEHKLTTAAEVLQEEKVAHSRLQAAVAVERSHAARTQVGTCVYTAQDCCVVAMLKARDQHPPCLQRQQAELEQRQQEAAMLSRRLEQGEEERSGLRLALADAQAAAADGGVEARAAAARAERLHQELDLVRSEADSQLSLLRSQAAAREERLAAQWSCRLSQLQSSLDAQGAAAADTAASLEAANVQVEQLTAQVSLRQHAS
jgi:hypothetical protein